MTETPTEPAPRPCAGGASTDTQHLYEKIGANYSSALRTEPRIACQILAVLGNAETLLRIGAGSGTSEPRDRQVTAVEPSAVMRAQRPPDAALCVAAPAGALRFPARSFDSAMAILSDRHWPDPIAGLREIQRVAKRVIVFPWENTMFNRFWLVRDCLPEFAALAARGPSLEDRARAINARIDPVPILWDCTDGFFHAYWRRPEHYLQDTVRNGSSVWVRLGKSIETRAVQTLGADLTSHRWQSRNADLLGLDKAELGARPLISDNLIANRARIRVNAS